jgi:hypothetical protein
MGFFRWLIRGAAWVPVLIAPTGSAIEYGA